jgi:DNA-binding MarR family transcriptional regulator
MDDPLIKLPGYSLRRAANAMMAELSGRLAEIDMRQADASSLIIISANPDITASRLGRMIDIRRANMVPLLNRLEEAGLISRTPIDGKSQGLTLTEAGKAKLAETMRIIDKFEAELLQRVPAEHRDHLLPALNALWR